MTESLSDFIGRNAIRKPLLILAGIAVIMTIKNARYSINYIKSSKLSPFSSRKTASSSLFSPYAPANNGFGGSSSASNQFRGGATGGPRPFGQQQQQFGAARGAAVNSGYPPSTGFGNQGSPQFGNNLRPAAATPSFGAGGGARSADFSTSNLVDTYGANVNVVQGGMFHDFGSSAGFSGQIETASAPDGFGFVDQVLRSPGSGKVLVVDGGGMSNGALFDASMASVAQQNGWKGVIINGYIRNAPALQNMAFGVKALGTHPSKGMQSMGQRNVPLMFGGVNFTPGAWVYADKDGIVVSQSSLNGGGGMPMNGGGGMPMNGGGMMSPASPSVGGSGMYGGNGMGMAQQPIAAQQMQGMASTQQFGMKPGMPQQQFPQSRGSGITGVGGASGMTGVGASMGGYGGQGGGIRPAASSPQFGNRGRTSSLRGASSLYGRGSRRKKPSKKTLLAILLFICAVVFVLLGD